MDEVKKITAEEKEALTKFSEELIELSKQHKVQMTGVFSVADEISENGEGLCAVIDNVHVERMAYHTKFLEFDTIDY